MHQAAIFEKMLAFLREGVDFIDTLKTASIVLAVFRLSKKQIALLTDAGASQSSVLLRTEENPNRKNWRRVRQFFLLSDW